MKAPNWKKRGAKNGKLKSFGIDALCLGRIDHSQNAIHDAGIPNEGIRLGLCHLPDLDSNQKPSG